MARKPKIELNFEKNKYFFRPFYERYLEGDQTRFGQYLPAKIVVVGCGGTGGYLIPLLARYLSTSQSLLLRAIQIVLVDGDTVSEKNILRQNFVQAEIGMNKAESIAERCNMNFGTNIDVVPDFLTSTVLDRIVRRQPTEALPDGISARNTLIIGCVDRDEARKLICDYLVVSNRIFYIDVGNELKAGQVFLNGLVKTTSSAGSDSNMTSLNMTNVYPKIKDAEAKKAAPSCAEQTAGGLQRMDVNVKAATLTFEVICSILSPAEVPFYEMTFGPGVVRSEKLDNLKLETASDGSTYLTRP